jgi:hypothetical protein
MIRRSGQTQEIATLPRWIEPQLYKLVEKASAGDQWVHEIKFDRCRMVAPIDRGKVQLLTRSGLDWTTKYPATAAGPLRGGTADCSPSPRLARPASAARWRCPRCTGFALSRGHHLSQLV